MNRDYIDIEGAGENNSKDIDVRIPRDRFAIMIGVSGFGKASLAFNTVYVEGQQRYAESLSAYARQSLSSGEKPDVDSIEGLSPSISIDRKTTSNNPRSTVGVVMEIYDYLRLLYVRMGIPYCPTYNEPIASQAIKRTVDRTMEIEDGARLTILSPTEHGRKGTYRDSFEHLRKEDYIRVRVDGEVKLLENMESLEENKKHNIDVVIDWTAKESDRSRLHDSSGTVLKLSDGLAVATHNEEEVLFSSNYSCRYCGFSIPKLEPRLFSSNASFGAYDHYKGPGITQRVDVGYLIPDRTKSIRQGGVIHYKNIVGTENLEWQCFRALTDYYEIDIDKPIRDLEKSEPDILLYGFKDLISYRLTSRNDNVIEKTELVKSVCTLTERRYTETSFTMSRG